MSQGTNLDLLLSTDYLSLEDERILEAKTEKEKVIFKYALRDVKNVKPPIFMDTFVGSNCIYKYVILLLGYFRRSIISNRMMVSLFYTP